MEWSDSAIVLSARTHGESNVILETLTRDHGRHLGLVYGGASRRARPGLQPGNGVALHWRARLSEHLGNFTVELARARAGALMESRDALAGLNAFAAMAGACLPEREVHAPVFEVGEILLDAMMENDARHWLPLYVRWEAGLMDALGFGLDLSECAVSGTSDDLAYVSPRTGRAVSRAGAGIYADRLFKLPGFLRGAHDDHPEGADILSGLQLTAHFLLDRVLAPQDRTLPPARLKLESLVTESR